LAKSLLAAPTFCSQAEWAFFGRRQFDDSSGDFVRRSMKKKNEQATTYFQLFATHNLVAAVTFLYYFYIFLNCTIAIWFGHHYYIIETLPRMA
jgi:hypothetical protein